MTTLVALAEMVERASFQGDPLAELIDELEAETSRQDRHARSATPSNPEPAERWRRVLGQVRRDAETGRVRSVTGLAREARRFASELERRSAAVAT